jgi:hypothetical protein
MNIAEKMVHEDAFEVKVYKEGVFWVGYEQSAYHIWLQKSYSVHKRCIKKLKTEIVRVGFPSSALPGLFPGEADTENPRIRVVRLETPIDMEQFQAWKAGLPLPAPPPDIVVTDLLKSGSNDVENLLEALRQFPLANKTPVECMIFLSKIRQHGALL